MTTRASTPIPDLSGRIALVTGATSGIGLVTAERLGAAGAETVLAVRDEVKARRVVAQMRSRNPRAAYRTEVLDLADLASVRACAGRLLDQGRPLDILVNNAGTMPTGRERQITADGFELALGTNFLGPFALTAGLLPVLRHSYYPRVVSVGSLSAFRGRLALDKAPTRYSPTGAYARSKLALTIFARELQRRSDAYGWGLTSVVAHPGWTETNLRAGWLRRFAGLVPLINDADQGALPTLVAATRKDLPGGTAVGPDGQFQLVGDPGPVRLPRRVRDSATAARLWETAEELTGATWPSS